MPHTSLFTKREIVTSDAINIIKKVEATLRHLYIMNVLFFFKFEMNVVLSYYLIWKSYKRIPKTPKGQFYFLTKVIKK